MAPAQLSDDVVASVEHVADPHRVVAAWGHERHRSHVSRGGGHWYGDTETQRRQSRGALVQGHRHRDSRRSLEIQHRSITGGGGRACQRYQVSSVASSVSGVCVRIVIHVRGITQTSSIL